METTEQEVKRLLKEMDYEELVNFKFKMKKTLETLEQKKWKQEKLLLGNDFRTLLAKIIIELKERILN